jgi:hypothetical protein
MSAFRGVTAVVGTVHDPEVDLSEDCILIPIDIACVLWLVLSTPAGLNFVHGLDSTIFG